MEVCRLTKKRQLCWAALFVAVLFRDIGQLAVAEESSVLSDSSSSTVVPDIPGYRPIYGPFPETGPPLGSAVTLPDEMPILLPEVYDPLSAPRRKLNEFKDGFFQKASFTATWLDQGDLGDVGITELDTFFTVVLPAPTKKMPLFISPGFAVNLLDGPAGPSAPGLSPCWYEVTTEFRWLAMLGTRWGFEFAVIPGIYADDLNRWDQEAFRLKSRATALYKYSATKSVVLGVSYLDRNDINLLPIIGVICKPNDDWRYELVFPQPKVARRFACGPDWDDWCYVAAEFGGDEYSYESVPGMRHRLTYRDLRIQLGLERKQKGGGGRRIEIGYIFDRRFEFDDGIPDYLPDNTVTVRAGFTF